MDQQLTQLSNVIDCLRTDLNKDLPIQHVAILLAVVEQPGINMQSLVPLLNMSQACVSRNIKILAEQYELLDARMLPNTRRRVTIYPTEKCTEIVAKLCELMQD